MSLFDAVSRNADRLLGKENVVGVGEGDGKVVVFVYQKKPLHLLAAADVVERFIDDPDEELRVQYRTDVIECGEIKALDVQGDKYEQLQPGSSIGLQGVPDTGTLGCFVQKNEELFILSNNHVIANCNEGIIGSPIIHPGNIDAFDGAEVVAELKQYVPLVFSDTANNRYDAALGKLLPDSDIAGNVNINSEVVTAKPGEEVHKRGRTTGFTNGIIQAVNATMVVDYGEFGTARFIDQVVTTPMLDPGDSGSVGYDSEGRPFGLGFAGSTGVSLFNRLDEVLEKFGVKIYNPESEEPEESESSPNFWHDLFSRIWRWLCSLQ